MDRRLFRSGKLVTSALAAAVMLFACACAVEQAERIRVGDAVYGVTVGSFRGQWYDYYERGASYIEGALAADLAGREAVKTRAAMLGVADLERAAAMRGEDQRRARTYGMHLADYFPRREMGVGYYLLGDYERAAKELETSLSSVESAKAQFFLDRVREMLIRKRGGDVEAPTVEVASIPERTPLPEITVRLKASDDGYVSSVVIDGAPLLIPLSAKSLDVQRKIALEEGENEIKITATDLSGNTTEKSLFVTSDTSGPVISVDETEVLPGSRMRIRGRVFDPAGVGGIKIGRLNVPVGGDGSFGAVVPAGPGGEVEFVAEDSLGNKTAGSFSGNRDAGRNGDFLHGTLGALINSRQSLGPLLSRWIVNSAAATAGGGPRIKLRGLTDEQEVYFDSFYVEGEASDPSGVARLVVGRKSLISRPGRKVYFNYLRRLHTGANYITIVGRNGRGVSAQKRIKIVKKTPKVRQVGSRMSAAVLPFHLKGRVNLGEVAYDNLLKYLKRSERFRLVDRTRIDSIVRELKLSEAGLTDQNGAVKAGRIAASETSVLGYVYETTGSIEVYARVVDVESGKILAEKDAYLRRSPMSLVKLMRLMRGLSVKIRNQFPMVEGEVAGVKGESLSARLEFSAPLKEGTRFIVFREKPVFHPETGMKLGDRTLPVAEARIASVSGKNVKAEIIASAGSAKISDTDKVITK